MSTAHLVRASAALIALAGCKPNAACGIGGSGNSSPKQDPVEFLADYDGPAFSELADVEVDRDTVWFCSGVIGLNAYDASNPKRLKFLDRIDVSVGSSVYPRCQHLAVAPNDTVYITNRANSIQPDSFIAAIDGSDPKHLIELSARVTAEEIEGITVSGGWLYAAAHGAGLLVLDRDTLQTVSSVSVGLSNAWQVRVAGGIAWIADGEAGLTAVDVHDPMRPEHIVTVPLGGQAKDLEIVGSRAWVAIGSAGVAVVDLSNPTEPTVLDTAQTPGSALGVAVSNQSDALYVADWNDIRVFDISNRDRLELVGHEPLLSHSNLDSRTLGIAAGSDDLLFSGNWTALSSYRYHPSRRSGDLDLSPGALTLARTNPGDTTNALLQISNAGTGPLEIDGVDVHGKGLQASLDATTLKPGATATARISWTPRGNAPLNGWLNLRSSDADEPKKCVPVSGNHHGLSVGDPFPTDQILGLDGETHSVGAHEGQVVLFAYFATF